MASQEPMGSETISIRMASPADANDYRDLRLEALREHPDAFSSDYASNAARPMSFWDDRLRASGSPGALTLFFAFDRDGLIGMCGVAPGGSPKTAHSAFIVSVYVRPRSRGRGVANALLQAALVWARAQGIRIVKLGVGTNNAAAIRCYARQGFRVYGLEPLALCHAGQMLDELLMAREL